MLNLFVLNPISNLRPFSRKVAQKKSRNKHFQLGSELTMAN